jgi:TnpA family transposase
MARQELLTNVQRKELYALPKYINDRNAIRYYTLSDEEVKVVYQQRGGANRLGFAIQIAYLRFPGRSLASGEVIPDYLVHRVADQLSIVPSAIHNYAKNRDVTRREHLSKIRKTFHYRSFTIREYRELAQWLLPTAMVTDKDHVLVEVLMAEMRKSKIILTAIYALEHLPWVVRERA